MIDTNFILSACLFTILIFLSNFFYLLTPYKIYNIRFSEAFYIYSFYSFFSPDKCGFLFSFLAILISKLLYLFIEYPKLKKDFIFLLLFLIEFIPIFVIFILFRFLVLDNVPKWVILFQIVILIFLFYLLSYLLIESINLLWNLKSFFDNKRFILFFSFRNFLLNIGINLLLVKVLLDLGSILWAYIWLIVLLPIVLIGRNYNWLISAAKFTIENISKIVDSRNPYASNHSLIVAEVCRDLAIKLKLDYEEITKIYHAAKIMNLGYISIPEYIFSKNTPLSENEKELIHKHPVVAANILMKLNSYSEVALIVKHHHENWDGSGYPDKLKADTIPLGSRIIRICDVFIALISDRAYRKAYSIEQAIDIMKQNQHQFDPRILPVFWELINEKKEIYLKLLGKDKENE